MGGDLSTCMSTLFLDPGEYKSEGFNGGEIRRYEIIGHLFRRRLGWVSKPDLVLDHETSLYSLLGFNKAHGPPFVSFIFYFDFIKVYYYINGKVHILFISSDTCYI